MAETYNFTWTAPDLDRLTMHSAIVVYMKLATGGYEPQLRIVAHVHDGFVFTLSGSGTGMKFYSVPLSQCDPASLVPRDRMAELARGPSAAAGGAG